MQLTLKSSGKGKNVGSGGKKKLGRSEGRSKGGREGGRGKANKLKCWQLKESGRRICKGSLHDSYKFSINRSLKLV